MDVMAIECMVSKDELKVLLNLPRFISLCGEFNKDKVKCMSIS